MPIPFYNLHDQTAEELAAELVRQIPAHTPEWRNPTPGDPGRALIDLFAWMSDKLLYRVNLLPERQRLMFLKILDMPLRPATPAKGLLQLSLSSPKDLSMVDLPARSVVPGPVEFETIDAAHILPVQGQVYAKRRPNELEAGSVSGIQSDLEMVYEIESSQPYVASPLFKDNRTIEAGFDVARDTIDQCLWIALLAPEAPEDKQVFREVAFTRNGSQPRILNIGIVPKADAPISDLIADAPTPNVENWIWQVPKASQTSAGLPEYGTLATPIVNTTNAFTKSGVIRLILPDIDDIGLPENDPDIDVLAGVGDRPPRVDDPYVAARLVGWVRLKARETAETLSLSWLGINSVEIEQRRSLSNVVIGKTASGSGQEMPLPAQSVDASSLVIDVQREDGLYTTWSQTDDFTAHGPNDTVYKLDAEAGTIKFGNGVWGKVPAAGAKVKASILRHGGGVAGNLPANSLSAISHPRLKALQPISTKGGAEAETLSEAEERLPSFLRHGDRAVTESDYKSLAPLTPGVDLARVEVLPRFRPYQRLSDVAGSVSVMIVPQPSNLLYPNPRPDRPMLSAVTDFLDERRLIGTELYVIGPEYKPVSVSISVNIKDGFEPDKVIAEVENILRVFLAPVAPGGREGDGWKLGRSLTNLELEIVAAQVVGLEAIFGVNLFERNNINGEWSVLSQASNGTQTQSYEEWMLPELHEIVVTQDPNGPSTTIDPGSSTGAGSLATPIPVVPEIC